MARDAESAVFAARALRLDADLLCHHVVEAGLAVELCAVVADKERDRAAVLALEVAELVAVQGAHFLAVAEGHLGAWLTEEVFGVHVLAQRTIVVILAAVVDAMARIAVVKSHLLHHELERVGFLLCCEAVRDVVVVPDFHCSRPYVFNFRLL